MDTTCKDGESKYMSSTLMLQIRHVCQDFQGRQGG